MHGIGLDDDVRTWFEPRSSRRKAFNVPRTTVPPDLIENSLAQRG